LRDTSSNINRCVSPNDEVPVTLELTALVPALIDGAGHSHVAGMQRRRLLTAVIELIHEGGVQAVSVTTLCERAGLSRRTFYELFEGRDGCLHAAFTDTVETATLVASQAVTDGMRWCEKVRAGLLALLALFDGNPGMGRLLIVDALGLGRQVLATRKHVLAEAAHVINEGRAEVRTGRAPPPLTAEGIVGAVLSVVHARMVDDDPQPLAELTGQLMALIVHPYLGSVAARRELERTTVMLQPLVAHRLPADPFKDLPIRLTYRTALVLTSIARSPGASNRQVATASGISDAGQISRLLSRLHRHGLVQDLRVGPIEGMARAWSLTERGVDVLLAIGQPFAVNDSRRRDHPHGPHTHKGERK